VTLIKTAYQVQSKLLWEILKSKKCRTLVSNCGSQGGGAAVSHPHPYMTADNKNVIFNADPFGICHVLLLVYLMIFEIS
jgi:hypothetical protein